MSEKKTKGSANAEQPSGSFNWEQASSQASGFENVHKDDLGVPFLMIIQKGSPEFDKTAQKYAEKKIAGVEPGDIINTLTREIVYKHQGPPLIYVPCSYEKLFMEWKPRESGGGIVKAHRDASILNECTRNTKGLDVLRNGNIVVTTAYFFGLHVRDEERSPVILSMTSTQMRKARGWLNMMQSIKLTGKSGKFTPPMYSHKYAISTEVESNTKGSWYGWHVSGAGQVTDPVLIADSIKHAQDAARSQRAALPPASESSEEDAPAFA